MPEVRATTEFFDRACRTVRHVGSEFYVDEARAAKLAALGMVVAIGVPATPDEPEPEAEEAPAPKRSRKKKE